MKNQQVLIFFLISCALVFSFSGYAQQLTRIDYAFYTSWYSAEAHIPIVVEYTLTAAHLSCQVKKARVKKFMADAEHCIPDLNKDYRKSGYDRGHNMSAADNCCDGKGMQECFYFSNMTPQPHAFNAGKWEELEEKERLQARQFGYVIVTCGSLGKARTIGCDSVVVPKYMWKVIYVPEHAAYACYLFPNAENVTETLDHYQVKLHEIEEKAGVAFKSGVVAVKQKPPAIKN